MSKDMPDIDEIMTEYYQAKTDFDFAHEKSQEARRTETEAINRLNRAQKAIDDWYKKMRAAAPWDTDWRIKKEITDERGQ